MSYPADGRIAHLTDFQRRATIPIIVCAGVSVLATSTLLIYLAVNDFKEWRLTRINRKRDSYIRRITRARFKNQGYFWLVNLFIADFIQAFAIMLSSYNIARNRVWPGFACNVQGFLVNIGDVSSSIWSLVIAIHTILLLACGQRIRAWVAEKSTMGYGRWIICICTWLLVICLGLIGPLAIQKIDPSKGPFYNASGGWCWIGRNYPYERIFFHYFFIFTDMISLTFLYTFGFCYIRIQLRKFKRTLNSTEQTTTGDQELERWRADLETTVSTQRVPPDKILTTRVVSVTSEERGVGPLTSKMANDISYNLRPASMNQSQLLSQKRMLQVAGTLLWYPLVYLCTTIPLAVSRLATFPGDHWATISIYPSVAIYACGGCCNVLLYTITRKGIVSWSSLFRRKEKAYDSSRRSSGAAPFSPTSSIFLNPLGQNYESRRSTVTSTLQNSPKKRHIPLIIESPPSSRRNSRPDIQCEVDFSRVKGYDTANTTDDSRLAHDRYCVQTPTGSRRPSSSTTICSSKNAPKYEMNSHYYT